MRQLSIFDDGNFIARISFIDNISFLFAKTPRQWSDMKRLLDAAEKLHEADSSIDTLGSLIQMLHSYDYSTEIIDE